MNRNTFIQRSMSSRPLGMLSARSSYFYISLALCVSLWVGDRLPELALHSRGSAGWLASVNFCSRHCAGFSDHYQPPSLRLCSRARSVAKLTRGILPVRAARTEAGRRVLWCSCVLKSCATVTVLPMSPLSWPLDRFNLVHLLTKHQTAYYGGVKRPERLLPYIGVFFFPSLYWWQGCRSWICVYSAVLTLSLRRA